MVLFHRPRNSALAKRKVPVQRSTLQRKLLARQQEDLETQNRQLRNLHAHQQRSRLDQPKGVVEDTGAEKLVKSVKIQTGCSKGHRHYHCLNYDQYLNVAFYTKGKQFSQTRFSRYHATISITNMMKIRCQRPRISHRGTGSSLASPALHGVQHAYGLVQFLASRHLLISFHI